MNTTAIIKALSLIYSNRVGRAIKVEVRESDNE